MEANRMGITPSPSVITKLRLEFDTFGFAKKLNVGDKGDMKFSAVIKAHRAAEGEGDDENKTLRFTNIELNSTRNARMA